MRIDNCLKRNKAIWQKHLILFFTSRPQVETVFGSPNMTVAYHVTGGDIVYPPSVVLEGLDSYGRDKLIADLRQYLPMVTALPLPAALWRPGPAAGFQLKTGQLVCSRDHRERNEITQRSAVIVHWRHFSGN